MQRITIRWIGALTAILGVGGLATAQNAPSYYPAIPQAPNSIAQPVQPGPNAPWAYPPPAPAAGYPQYRLVQAQTQPTQPGQPGAQPVRPGVQPAPPVTQPTAPGAPPAGQALTPPTPGSYPYFQPPGSPPYPPPTVTAAAPYPTIPPGYNPGPFGTYGAPPYHRGTAFGVGLAPVPYNEYCPACANGCGSLKSDLGFVLGSCKSFFNPCGPIPCQGFGGGCGGGGCGHGCGHILGGWNKCPAYPYGQPYGHGFNTCNYDSYLNH